MPDLFFGWQFRLEFLPGMYWFFVCIGGDGTDAIFEIEEGGFDKHSGDFLGRRI
jgi:hypothetical protein